MIVISKKNFQSEMNGFDNYKSARYQVRALNLDFPDVLFCLISNNNLDIFYSGSQLHISHNQQLVVENRGRRFADLAKVLVDCDGLDYQQSIKLFEALKSFVEQTMSLSKFLGQVRVIGGDSIKTPKYEFTHQCNDNTSLYKLYSSRVIDSIDPARYDKYLIILL